MGPLPRLAAALALLALACRGDGPTVLVLDLVIDEGVHVDRLDVSLRVDGLPRPGPAAGAFSVMPGRPLVTGDSVTFRFPDEDGGKTVELSGTAYLGAQRLVDGLVLGQPLRLERGTTNHAPFPIRREVADGGPLPDGSSVDSNLPSSPDAPPPGVDAAAAPADAATVATTFCALGRDIPGAVVPDGFCLRRFATVPEVRTMIFAPNGDLIVAAPSTSTPGGASGGPAAILVLSDDDHDGAAEVTAFATRIPDVHGLTLGDGYLYFTTQQDVWRTPYTGQRREMGTRERLGLPATFGDGGRWTHGLARSVGGALYASRGQYGACGGSGRGEISRVAMASMNVVANGLRNPMYLRCHYKDEVCAAAELGEDGQAGAREKLLALRPQTDYGYPCCQTKDKPAPMGGAGACAAVDLEDASFVLSETPFGFDWERDLWPAPYKGALFVALHGSFYSSPAWAGARIVRASVDPLTHMPTEAWHDFVGGFGPGGSPLERPADVTFAPDGRMFFADDQGGTVYWVAPTSLARPH